MKCKIEVCQNEKYCLEYCNAHYLKLQRYGDPLWERQLKKEMPCSVEGCEEKGHTKGMCTKHYAKIRRTGTLDKLKRKGPVPGELSQLDSMRDPRPGYRGFYAANTIDDIRNKARRRGKEWLLASVEAYKLIIASCVYCGYTPNWPESRVGIDRVDNSKGYVPGNCVPCCSTCNSAKGELSEIEFLEWVTRIYNHLNRI
jgi:hypothetical protein